MGKGTRLLAHYPVLAKVCAEYNGQKITGAEQLQYSMPDAVVDIVSVVAAASTWNAVVAAILQL